MPTPERFDSTVERELNAGFALFELCEDEDVALEDAWEGNDDQLRVEPGRVGVVSAAVNHFPEIALASYRSEPGPVDGRYAQVGEVEVEWRTHQVELWTSNSYVGEARRLTLPASSSGRYHLRAARAFAPQVKGDLTEYLWEHDDGVDKHGLELWRFDFWPA